MNMKKVLILITFILILFIVFKVSGNKSQTIKSPVGEEKTWVIKSVDTMKYSRDLSLEKLDDSSFDQIINFQVKVIKETNANYVAIGTPYDEKFLPYLARWVKAARNNDLRVWFRGNFSGWEGWFGYPKDLSREEHINFTRAFIKNNSGLFRDGDIFSPCPECENGGPGDPRYQTPVSKYREFLILERDMAIAEFKEIGKEVIVLDSMNFDVARLVMDKQTAQAMGNMVVIDHYVKTPKQLVDDIEELNQSIGAKIMLGEFGVPIPDIHGDLTEEEQAVWIDQALRLVSKHEAVIGLNYWVGVGGSTAIFNDDLSRKKGADVLSKYFNLK